MRADHEPPTPVDAAVREHGPLQRAFLLRLDELTELETAALNRGDLDALCYFSEQRAHAAAHAAAYTPPLAPWVDDLMPMVEMVGARTHELQDSLRDCLVEIRRELASLADPHHLKAYGGGVILSMEQARWSV